MMMRGSRTRVVAGGVLVAVAALLVMWLLREKAPGEGLSDATRRGEPSTALPAMESPPVAKKEAESGPPRVMEPEAVAAESTAEPEGLDGMPMHLTVRDGTTGKALTVRSIALVSGSSVARFPRGVESVDIPADGDANRLTASPFVAGRWGDYGVQVELPDGYAVEHQDAPTVGGLISAFAEAVEAEVLVWPEARVRVLVLEADGSPAKGAEVYWAEVAGEHVKVQADLTDFRGESVVRGVPFLRGERVTVSASIEDRSADSSPEILKDRIEEVLVRVVLPKEAPPLNLESGVGTMSGGRKGGHKSLTIGDTGAIRVKVLRMDGRPAPEVTVQVGVHSSVTGSDGVAVFPKVVIGEREAFVSEPGFHTQAAKVIVTADREAFVELHQANGESAEVVVLDDEGRPVAGASLSVVTQGGVRYCLMKGGTQVLGIHTGPDGRRTLPGLPPGSATVLASFGSREAEGTVAPGGTVEIRLPAVK